MSALTLEQAQQLLTAWVNADLATAKGQSYQIGDVSVTRADAKTIQEKIQFYSSLVTRLSSGRSGPRVRRFIPRDI